MKNTELLNLRTTPADPALLAAVPAPDIIAPDGWTPFAVHDGRLLITSGLDLAATVPGADPDLIVTLPAIPRCVHCHDNTLYVMTDAGPFLITYDPVDHTFRPLGAAPHWPQVSLTVARGGVYSGRVPSVTVADVSDACTQAYIAIAEKAAAAGAFLQPVMAAVRFLDDRGNSLHRTPPVLLMPADGSPLTDPWRFSFAGEDSGKSSDLLNPLDVSASGYRIALDFTDMPPVAWAGRVARLQVLVTPQFHPWQFGRRAEVSRTSSVAGATPLTVTPPVRLRDIAATGSVSARGLVLRACERFDDLAVVAADILTPFDLTDRTLTVDAPPVADIKAAAEAFFTALDTPVTQSISTVPQCFAASAVAVTPAACLWANPQSLRPLPPNPGSWASVTLDRRWYGQCLIDYADGSAQLTEVNGSAAPTAFSPLLFVPYHDAVRLRLRFYVDGDEQGVDMPYSLDVPLSPVGTLGAAYLAGDRRAFTLQRALSDTPLPTPAEAFRAPLSGLLAAPADDPLMTRSFIPVPHPVTAVMPARSPSGSWLFGRHRFYVFTAHSVYMLTLAADMSSASLAVLFSSGVPHGACVCDSPGGVCALSAGSIVRFAAASVRILHSGVSGNRLGWCADPPHFVVADTDDNVARHFPDEGSPVYTTTLVTSGGWLAHAGRVYACTGGGIADLASRTDLLTPVDIAFRVVLAPSSHRRQLPRRISLMLRSSGIHGQIALRRHYLVYGRPVDTVLASCRLSGAVTAPVTLHTGTTRFPSFQYALHLTAAASPDTRISLPSPK